MQGRTALVTGGAKGIGRAIADRLAAEGAIVSVLGRDEAALASTGHRYIVADVTDDPSLKFAIEQLGPLDILVNNAGAAMSAPFARQGRAEWDEMIAVNLSSCFVASQCVVPAMVARRWGRIVNIASTAALKGYAYTAAYCAAKHGLLGLTRALAVELAPTGVTVNAVCPGFTDTPMVDRAIAAIVAKTGRTASEALTQLARSNPQGRLVRPAEVASAIAYLCRAESAALTGQSIVVAGGEVM